LAPDSNGALARSALPPLSHVAILKPSLAAGNTMQSEKKILDDLARMANAVLGTVMGAREEMTAQIRQRIERVLTELDLVPRDEFDAARDMAAQARVENEALATRVANLEAAVRVAGLTVAPVGAPRATARSVADGKSPIRAKAKSAPKVRGKAKPRSKTKRPVRKATAKAVSRAATKAPGRSAGGSSGAKASPRPRPGTRSRSGRPATRRS